MSKFGRFIIGGSGVSPLVLAFALALAATAARAEFDYKVVSGVTTNTWIGATGGDWQTAGNWSPATVPAAGGAGTGNYALFNPEEALRVTPTAGSDYGFAATGVIIAPNAAQVTIQPTTTWGQSAFKLRRNGENSPAIINLSANRLILNVPVTFGSYGSSSIGGVLPGVEYGQKFNGEVNATFYFYPGDAEANDAVNTSVIKGAATFKAVSIGANHIVEVLGNSASMTATTLTVLDGGSLVVSNATLTATSLSGAMTLAGAATVSAESLGSVKWTLRPVFKSVTGTGLVADTVKIAKKEGVAAPTADDFTLGAASGLTAAARNLLSVDVDSTSDSDYYLVTVKPTFAVMTGRNAYNTDWTAENLWNGAESIVAGTHYLVQGTNHRINTDFTEKSEFAGASLTIAGDSYGQCYLGLKGLENTVGALNLGANGEVRFHTYNTLQSSGQTLKGSIYVGADATDAAPACIGTANGNANVSESVISGTGTLRIAAYNTTTAMNLALNGQSPDFTGSLQLCGYDGYPATVSITDSAALGTGGLMLSNATLKIAGDVTLSGDARTVQIADASAFEVESGKTLEVGAALSFSDGATLTKSGAGTLVLSGDNSAAVGTIAVSDGSLQAAGAYATGRITVSGGAGILPAVTAATAEEEKARKMAERDWLFVPDGTTANTPAQNLALVTARGWTLPGKNYGLKGGWIVTLTQEAVNGGVMLRLSAKKAGLVITLR